LVPLESRFNTRSDIEVEVEVEVEVNDEKITQQLPLA
jgi:hypothetical protein